MIPTDHYTRKRQKIEALFAPYRSPFDLDLVDIAIQPLRSSPRLTIRIPTGSQAHLAYVEPTTVFVVFLAIIYMAYAIRRASTRFTNNLKKEKTD